MSNFIPIRPRQQSKQVDRIAIVASQYNNQYVQPLVDHCCNEIYAINPRAELELFNAPGAFEVPLMVKLAAARQQFSAIIALGVILRGATAHADLIARGVTDSFQKLMLEFEIPIIHEVLLLDDEAQARARCIDEKLNRGIEAARAAIDAIRSIADLRQK